MTTAAPPSPARPVWVFFGVTLAITWGLQFPLVLAQAGVLAGPPERFLPLAGIGGFGPLVAAALVARFHSQGGGAGALFAHLREWRGNAGWYLLALLMPGALLTAGMAAQSLLPGAVPQPWFYPPTEAHRIAALFLVPFVEEVGWRGFALPRLQARFGPLAAAVILGVVWAAWHVPMLLAAGVPVGLFPLMLVFFTGGSVVFSWMYNRVGGSLPLMIVAHMGAHLDSSHESIPGNTTPAIVHAVAYGLLALVLVLADRKAWSDPAAAAGNATQPAGA